MGLVADAFVGRGKERRHLFGPFSRKVARLASSRLLAQGMHTDMRRRVGVRRIYDPSVFFLSLRPTLTLVYDRTMLLISQFGKCRQWAAVTGLKRRAEKAAKKEVSLFGAQHFSLYRKCFFAWMWKKSAILH